MFGQNFLHGSFLCFDSFLFKVNFLVFFLKFFFGQLWLVIFIFILFVLLISIPQVFAPVYHLLQLLAINRQLLILQKREFTLHHHIMLQRHRSFVCVLHVDFLLLGSTDPVRKL